MRGRRAINISAIKAGADIWQAQKKEDAGVVIVGAGLAGLAAATELAAAGRSDFVLAEASDGVGGRVRTDIYKGFQLDRGSQIHITTYPEAQQILDYDALYLRKFYSGGLVWFDGKFHRVADPFKHFSDGLLSLSNPIGSVFDKILVGLVRFRLATQSDHDLLSNPYETSILERLRSLGFSTSIIDRFFRPFFGGIFFDTDLETTSRLFDFVFKCLALGSSTLPARGMGAIPQQIADRLPQSSILLNSRVTEVIFDDDKGGRPSGVRLANGQCIMSKCGVILATEGIEAWKLIGKQQGKTIKKPTLSITKQPRSTVCIYFETDEDKNRQPLAMEREPLLVLNGSGKGIVNTMFFPTSVSKTYAPEGKILVSVSLVGFYEDKSDEELEAIVREEVSEWFGGAVVATWRHLRTYRIRLAQPDQAPPTNLFQDTRLRHGLYICGDHRYSSTFDGALSSGKQAARALLADINQQVLN